MITSAYSPTQDLALAIVVGQIVTFQFLSAWFGAAGLAFTVGLRGLPEEVDRELRRAGRQARLFQLGAGSLLLVAVGLLATLPDLTISVRRLGLTAVSLLSAALFLWTYVYERHTAVRLRKRLPPPDRLTADLRPRKLSRAYPIWLEGLPPLLWVVTLLVTLLLASDTSQSASAQLGADIQQGANVQQGASVQLGAGIQPSPSVQQPGEVHTPPVGPLAADAALWEEPGPLGSAIRRFALPFVQGLLVVAGAWAARRILSRARYLPQKARAYLGPPAETVALDWSLRRLELRAFLAARVLIVAMLGVWQWQWQYAASAGQSAANAGASWLVWFLIAGMLLMFGIFQWRVRRLEYGS